MAKYSSKKREVNARVASVYGFLSDLSNLQPFASQIPADKVKNLVFNRDSVSFEVDPVGEVMILITNRIENKQIELGADKSPIPASVTIDLEEKDVYLTEISISIDADIPFYLKPMIGGKLDDGLNKFAEVLAMLPYAQLENLAKNENQELKLKS